MSRIDDLLSEYCPEGVEIKPLGQVGQFIRGNGLQKKDFVEHGVGCIHYGQIYTHYGTSATETKAFVTPALAAKLRSAEPGDLVVATTSENDADVAKAVAWLGDFPVAVSGDSYVFKHSLDPLYASYFFQTDSFQQQKRRFISGTKVKRVSGADLARIEIPVPPIAIQREIVSILTKMEALEAELEAELEARRRQYAHYRSELLTFSDPEAVRWVPLGEVAVIGTGSHDTKDAIPDGEFAFYARGREPLRLDSFDFDEQAIITAGDGVGVGNVFHFASGKYALHQRAYRIVPGAALNARYLYHYFVADFSRYLERTSVHASVTSLRRPMFLRYPVAVPSRVEQQRIAGTLDKFEEFVNGLSAGLPAELVARRQQYEHYRDRLFGFSRLAA